MPDDQIKRPYKTYLPPQVEDEPVFPDHEERDEYGFKEPLVPGSRFHDEQWVMAAGMLARGASFMMVARAMGCSRTTLWRAYYKSTGFRRRVWWERQQLNKEAELRLASLRGEVVEQVQRLVQMGDGATIRWIADRLGLFGPKPEKVAQPEKTAQPAQEVPSDEPPALTMDDLAELNGFAQDPHVTIDDIVMDEDDTVPGALRERFPPDDDQMDLIAALPEADGPMGEYPWTLNPEHRYPSLGSKWERAGSGAFER